LNSSRFVEQRYKELREHFGFAKEENRIYEALVARITLSFFTYNIVSYINRISNEPKSIGGLFKDLDLGAKVKLFKLELP
jgi:hypothetical protein